MVRICETVSATTMAELRAARDAVVDADVVELRLDGVADVDVAGALEGRTRPVVLTCRPVWEGGRFDGSEEDRMRLLVQGLALGAEFVDVEWRADRRDLPRDASSRLVLSHHDFAGVPADLADRVRAMRAERPGVLKIAVMAKRLADCVRIRDAARGDGESVVIAMGASGQAARLWPAGFASAWTYAGREAFGQVAARELRHRYRVTDTTSRTAVYGVAGSPIGHSASPAMHNAAFAALGIDAVYLPLETDDASDLVAFADGCGLAGISVTAPLKQACLSHCVSTDETAANTGAVNTLIRTADGWAGRNFDVAGFLAPLDRRGLARAGERALVLGAGGASRAVVFALRSRGLHVAVAARRAEAARRVADDLGASVEAWPPRTMVDLLVNATPAGAWPRSGDAPVDLRSGLRARAVYDLVYNPVETTLAAAARAAGADAIGGLEMLVEQAAHQFEVWTHRPAPREVMDRAARAFLRESES